VSDKESMKSKLSTVANLLSREKSAKPLFPSSALVIKSITPQQVSLEPDEQAEEYTAEDYDNWVLQAFLDLIQTPQRFHAHPDTPELLECPRERLFRIGREANADGSPSEMYQYLMELTNNGTKLPHVTKRAMGAAQRYLDIAVKFRDFTKNNKNKYTNFKELKYQFRLACQFSEMDLSASTLERALKAHDLNWSAYAIEAPRKGTRKKRP
jgi:hypothetical protein